MGELVAIETDDGVEIHASNCAGTDHASLCGMDGDDQNDMVNQSTVPLPRGAKINCVMCASIILYARAFRVKQIDTKILDDIL